MVYYLIPLWCHETARKGEVNKMRRYLGLLGIAAFCVLTFSSCILDPDKKWTPRWQDHHMIVDYNNWEGIELTGKVVTTILRGNVLLEDESWVGSKTEGCFQERKLLPEITSTPPGSTVTSEALA